MSAIFSFNLKLVRETKVDVKLLVSSLLFSRVCQHKDVAHWPRRLKENVGENKSIWLQQLDGVVSQVGSNTVVFFR